MNKQLPIALKELRKNENITQEQLSNAIGISQRAYAHYEQGDREPTITTLMKLAKFFRVSVDNLIGVGFEITIPEHKIVKAKYNLSNTELLAKVFEQVLEIGKATFTEHEAMNVLTGESWEESSQRAIKREKEKKAQKKGNN